MMADLNPVTRAVVQAELKKCEEALTRQNSWRNGLRSDLEKTEESIAVLEHHKRELTASLLTNVTVRSGG